MSILDGWYNALFIGFINAVSGKNSVEVSNWVEIVKNELSATILESTAFAPSARTLQTASTKASAEAMQGCGVMKALLQTATMESLLNALNLVGFWGEGNGALSETWPLPRGGLDVKHPHNLYQPPLQKRENTLKLAWIAIYTLQPIDRDHEIWNHRRFIRT